MAAGTNEVRDPSKCPECKGTMKPLFSGFYCPQDCDKPEVLAKRKAEAEAKAKDALEQRMRAWNGFSLPMNTWTLPITATTKYPRLVAGSTFVVPTPQGSVQYQRQKQCAMCGNHTRLHETDPAGKDRFFYACTKLSCNYTEEIPYP